MCMPPRKEVKTAKKMAIIQKNTISVRHKYITDLVNEA